ncbi:MAG: ATP-binding cassette domain-containing protein [Pseudomonadota bacterium]
MSGLSLDAVSFQASGKTLLGPVSMSLDPNASLAIMGPNGAGKSLLLELMHGLIAPSSGSLSWSGKTPSHSKHSRAYIFQRRILMRRSVRDNVAFALDAVGIVGTDRTYQIEQALEKTRLTDRADQPAALLSGGEAQRLALARAIATNPKSLLMDEPTSSLDPEATEDFERILADLKSNGTQLIWITHNRAQAIRLADQVAFINKGSVTELTPATTFFKSPASKPAKDFLNL